MMHQESLLSKLPGIEECRQIFKSIAILDAIHMPEWEYRYYSFNSKWDKNEMMASMRDGSGKHYFALFNQYGLIIKGFEHLSDTEDNCHKNGQIGKDIFAGVPAEFSGFLKEPAFIIEDTTFCIWNIKSKGVWYSNKVYRADELYLLKVLIGGAKGYMEWAEEYYEKEIHKSVVEDIFNFKPLNEVIVKSLNNEISMQDVKEDVIEIDYPCNN
jgi:hypothetical protein